MKTTDVINFNIHFMLYIRLLLVFNKFIYALVTFIML